MLKWILIFVGLSALWSCSQPEQEPEVSNTSKSQGVEPTPSASPGIIIDSTWQSHVSENGNTAWVETKGFGPNGEIKATLSIQCPAERNPLKGIKFIVHETGDIPAFDFDSFEGPDAPNASKKLLRIRVNSDPGQKEYTTSAAGWYGGRGEPDAFVFSPHTYGNIERAMVNGRAKISFTVSDTKNQTLEAKFPELDPASDVATTLKGCRK